MLMSIRDAALDCAKRLPGAMQAGRGQEPRVANLYAGAAGLALFLGYLGAVMNDNVSTECARTLVAGLKQPTEADDLPIGAFVGTGALLYLYAHLGTVWNDTNLWND